MNPPTDSKPAHRQLWFWLIWVIPAIAVIASVTVIVLAFSNQDSVVRDDWYKEGKAINQNIARDKEAIQMDQQAIVHMDELTGEIVVSLKQKSAENTLTLAFSHPTQVEKDQTLTLKRDDQGRYLGHLDHALEGRFYIELGSSHWRLRGEHELPKGDFTLSHD